MMSLSPLTSHTAVLLCQDLPGRRNIGVFRLAIQPVTDLGSGVWCGNCDYAGRSWEARSTMFRGCQTTQGCLHSLIWLQDPNIYERQGTAMMYLERMLWLNWMVLLHICFSHVERKSAWLWIFTKWRWINTKYLVIVFDKSSKIDRQWLATLYSEEFGDDVDTNLDKRSKDRTIYVKIIAPLDPFTFWQSFDTLQGENRVYFDMIQNLTGEKQAIR